MEINLIVVIVVVVVFYRVFNSRDLNFHCFFSLSLLKYFQRKVFIVCYLLYGQFPFHFLSFSFSFIVYHFLFLVFSSQVFNSNYWLFVFVFICPFFFLFFFERIIFIYCSISTIDPWQRRMKKDFELS